jgi:hypothetical protein
VIRNQNPEKSRLRSKQVRQSTRDDSQQQHYARDRREKLGMIQTARARDTDMAMVMAVASLSLSPAFFSFTLQDWCDAMELNS